MKYYIKILMLLTTVCCLFLSCSSNKYPNSGLDNLAINSGFTAYKIQQGDSLLKIANTTDTMTAIMVAEMQGLMTETNTEETKEEILVTDILDVIEIMITEIVSTEGKEGTKDPILTAQEVHEVILMIARKGGVMTIGVTKTIDLLIKGDTFARTLADMIEYP